MSPKQVARAATKAATPSNGFRNASRLAPPGDRIAHLSYDARAAQKQAQLRRCILAIGAAGAVATASQFYLNLGPFWRHAHAEAAEREANPLGVEASRTQCASLEEKRDVISSQHLQVKRSWANPGVYAWGSNAGRVVAPDSDEGVVKTPRRMACFDGQLLRDIKLDRSFGAAIDEHGDLVQWGEGYARDVRRPVTTLSGRDLKRLCISKDRILGVSRKGTVYSIPASAEDQAHEPRPAESSWGAFWSGTRNVAYRDLTPQNLARGERVQCVCSGLEHALLLTNKGRVFSAASASDAFPDRGQLGVPGLTWLTRPAGAFDQPHEITALRGFNIVTIACGDRHSLALDSEGRVFAWGDNASGQLGFDCHPGSVIVDTPSLLPTQKLYSGKSHTPRITHIAAGGDNSFITVDATRVASPKDDDSDPRTRLQIGRVTADTFAFGTGIRGSLANGRWTHVQSTPSKIPSLSGRFEYDEKTHRTVPIRLRHLSVGSTHAAAVMHNITSTDARAHTGPHDTNWGADVVFWGGNEHYQLGTGKRNNLAEPTYLQPLDTDAEATRAKKSSGATEQHRLHITPRAYATLGDGRTRWVEQRVECGRLCTAVYSGTD